ncbi:MAG: CRISPR-associated protein (TIGR02584 family) [Myxococcota bacterium]
MASSVFVFAVSGESPAVVLELLWWLCVVERSHIAGIEIWTTAPAEAALRTLIREVWNDFQQATFPLPALEAAGLPTAPGGFRIHVYKEGSLSLQDVRTRAEAARVNAVLHDRVRELRDELPPSIQLVGSLAGGRKVVSAAVQTAFCLQARRADRLVHVLLHADFEARLSANHQMHEYAYPTSAWADATGVPVGEQVIVYDVPFPRLRYMVPRRLVEALNGHSWDDVWPVLEQNTDCAPKATLGRCGDRWVYTIRNEDDVELYTTEMPLRPGSVLVAALSVDGPPTVANMLAWLDLKPALWSPTGSEQRAREEQLRGAGRDLRVVLGDLPMGLECFCVPKSGYRIEGDITVEDGAIAGIPARSP